MSDGVARNMVDDPMDVIQENLRMYLDENKNLTPGYPTCKRITDWAQKRNEGREVDMPKAHFAENQHKQVAPNYDFTAVCAQIHIKPEVHPHF